MFCDRENDTIATPALTGLGFDKIMQVIGNQITGTIGTCFDDLLIKKSLRKCRVIGCMEFGARLPNSSYTGVLGLLQSKQIDLYLRGGAQHLHEEWLQKTIAIHMDRIVSGHTLPDDPKDRNMAFFNLLENFKIGLALTAIYLCSLLAILVLSFFLHELAYKIQNGAGREKKIFKRLTSVVSSFYKNRLSAIGLFFVFVNLFIWFTQLFLTNNIKTNKVVVDTSQLIKDERDVFSTERTACTLENELFHNMIQNAPAKGILRKLFEKTKLRAEMQRERQLLGKERCLFSRNPKMFQFLASQDIFLIGERSAANLLFSAFYMAEGLLNRFWFNERPLHEFSKHLYYSLRKKENKKRIDSATLRQIESGIYVRMQGCVEKSGRATCRRSHISMIETLEDYIENFSGISDLGVENFRYIFIYLALICSLTFMAFSVHHLVDFIPEEIIRQSLTKLSSYFTRLASCIRIVSKPSNWTCKAVFRRKIYNTDNTDSEISG